MSFGVGFGDIVKAIALAKSVVTTYRNAPSQVRELGDEYVSSKCYFALAICQAHLGVRIAGLLGVLEKAHNILQGRKHSLAEYETTTLMTIVHGYTAILNKLRNAYNENYTLASERSNSVESKTRKMCKRLVFESSMIKQYRQEIMHYNVMLDSFVGLLNIQAVLDTHLNVRTLIDYKSTQEDQHLLTWLTSLDFGKQHTDILRRREPGTGTWFHDSTEFQAWVVQPQTTLLCPGMPGAGKSFIASIAVEWLQNAYSSNRETMVTFLLCDFKSQQEQSPVNLLASFLKQLIQDRPIPAEVQDLYMRFRSRPAGFQPAMDDLRGCLTAAMSSYKSVFIIIDALDELNTEPRMALLNVIFELQESFDLRVLATLRPIQELVSMFEDSGVVLHVLEIQARQDDIHKFLERKFTANLHFLRRIKHEEKERIQLEIKSSISKAAGGMFLLASLYLDSAIRCRTVKSIQTAIKELPKGPDAYAKLYADTLSRIQTRGVQGLAKQVLSWVAWTRRPMTICELQHAIAVEEGAMLLSWENTTDAGDLISSCEGLVTIDPKTNIIRLVHCTVQEYLETIRDTWFSNIETNILRVCLDVLSSPVFESGPCRTDDEFESRLRTYPLYDYACHYWGYHARDSSAMHEALVAFLEDDPKVGAASQCKFTYRGYCQSVPSEVTGLHLAALYGLDEEMSHLLRSGHRASQRTSYGQSALYLAAAQGSHSTIAMLLQHNAPVNCADNYGRTALSVAAEHGKLEVAKTLISHGAVVDLKDDFGRSPLSDASENGHLAVVNYLLQCCPNLNVDRQERSGKTPLWRAACNGHWEVVRVLLARGANIDASQKGVPTLLSWAASKNKGEAVDRLIAMNASIDLADQESRTPLSLAAEKGFLSIVAALLGHGANSCLADKDGWSPLFWACDSGRLDVVSLLVEHGPQTMTENVDRFGQTALSIASRAGYANIVKLLLGRDLQRRTVDMGDGTGWTPLIQAAKKGSNEVISLLLDRTGPAANAAHCDSAGKTALHWAAAFGNAATVPSLLRSGILINGRDGAGRTPLWYASRNGHVHTVEVLLNAHADMDISDVLQRTPLRLAIERGYDNIAEILVDHQGDSGTSVDVGEDLLLVNWLAQSPKVRQFMLRIGSVGEADDADIFGLHMLFA